MGKRGLPSDHVDEARNLSPMPETETGYSEKPETETGYSEISGGTNGAAAASEIAEQDQHTLQQHKDMEIDNAEINNAEFNNAEINNANHATSLHDKNTIIDDDVDPQLEKNLNTLKALKRTFLEQSPEIMPKIETKESTSNVVIMSDADAMEEDFNNFGDETALSEDQTMRGPTVVDTQEPREARITQENGTQETQATYAQTAHAYAQAAQAQTAHIQAAQQQSQSNEIIEIDEKTKEVAEEIVSEKPRNLFRESLLSSENTTISASKPDCSTIRKYPENGYYPSETSSVTTEDPMENNTQKPDSNNSQFPEISGLSGISEEISEISEEISEDHEPKIDDVKEDSTRKDSNSSLIEELKEINRSTRFHRPGASFYESFKKDKNNKESKESLSKEAYKELSKESVQESSNKINENTNNNKKISDKTNISKEKPVSKNNIEVKQENNKKQQVQGVPHGLVTSGAKPDSTGSIRKNPETGNSSALEKSVKSNLENNNSKGNTTTSQETGFINGKLIKNSPKPKPKQVKEKSQRNKLKTTKASSKSSTEKTETFSSQDNSNNSNQKENFTAQFPLGLVFPEPKISETEEIQNDVQDQLFKMKYSSSSSEVQGQPNVGEENYKDKGVSNTTTMKDIDLEMSTSLAASRHGAAALKSKVQGDPHGLVTKSAVAGGASANDDVRITANENENKNASIGEAEAREKISNSELDYSSQRHQATNDYSSDLLAFKEAGLSKNAYSSAYSVQGQPNVGDDNPTTGCSTWRSLDVESTSTGKPQEEKVKDVLDKSSFDLECPLLKQHKTKQQSTQAIGEADQGGELVQGATDTTIRNGPIEASVVQPATAAGYDKQEAVVNHASKTAMGDLNHDKNQDVFQDQDHQKNTNSTVANGSPCSSSLKKSSSFVQAENWVRERYTSTSNNKNGENNSISRKIAKDWVKNDNVEDNIVVVKPEENTNISISHENNIPISRKNKSAEQHWLEKDLMTEESDNNNNNENSREIKNQEENNNNRTPLSPARDFSSTSSIPSRFKNMLGSTSGSTGSARSENFRENATSTPRRGSIFERQNSIASNSISRKNSISSTTTTPFSSRTTSPEPPTSGSGNAGSSPSGKPYFNSARMATMVTKPPASFQKSQSTFHLNGISTLENQESKFQELKRSETQSTYQINQLKDLLQKDSIQNSEIRNSVKTSTSGSGGGNANLTKNNNSNSNAENTSPYNRSKSWHTSDSTSNSQAFTKSRENDNPRIQIQEFSSTSGSGGKNSVKSQQSPIREFSPIVLVRPSTFIKAMTPTPERRFNTKSKSASDKAKESYPDPPVDTRGDTRPGSSGTTTTNKGTENDKVPSRFRRAMQHSSSNNTSSSSSTSGSGNAGSGMTRSRSIHELHEASLGAKADNLQEQIRQARADHLRAYDTAQSHTHYNADSTSGYTKSLSDRARRGSPVRRTPSNRASEVTQAFQALGRMRNVRASSASNY